MGHPRTEPLLGDVSRVCSCAPSPCFAAGSWVLLVLSASDIEDQVSKVSVLSTVKSGWKW